MSTERSAYGGPFGAGMRGGVADCCADCGGADGASLTVEGWTPAGEFYRIQRGGTLGWIVNYWKGEEHVEKEDHASLEAASHAVSLGRLPDAPSGAVLNDR